MFDLLKKKLGSFAEQVKKKIEQKSAYAEKPLPAERLAEAEKQERQAAEKKHVPEETISEKLIEEKPEKAPPGKEEKLAEKTALARKPSESKSEELLPADFEEAQAAEESADFSAQEAPEESIEVPKAAEGHAKVSIAEAKRELKPRISIRGKLKAAITGTVELQQTDLKGLLWQLELALLEADVEQATAEEICRGIGERLAGKRISGRQDIGKLVKKEIREILLQIMQAKEFDLLREIKAKKEKPYRILFLGPNGSGKTTSIAKLTFFLQSKGLKAIWAASDTFRAASIEQLEKHASSLNVRVVKHQYGADPAAVAFDAVKAAEGKGIDVVLIDSAGRQETNRNLMGELQKIVRVAQPDLKIYVGESYTGQALLQQAKEYDKMIGIDGFILTKIDCDAKGGTTISLLHKLHKPILFVGTGQEYKDLKPFEPEFVLEKIIG